MHFALNIDGSGALTGYWNVRIESYTCRQAEIKQVPSSIPAGLALVMFVIHSTEGYGRRVIQINVTVGC